jgi:hydroxyacylglutathione hydrolase
MPPDHYYFSFIHDIQTSMKRLGSVYKNGPVEIHQIPAIKDNYIYLFRETERDFTAMIDPGEAAPVLKYCAERGWTPQAIFVTHHHWDHTDGIEELVQAYGCTVHGYKDDAGRIPCISRFWSADPPPPVAGHSLTVHFIPGHTLGHIALYFPDLKIVFTGDTLFSFGCGRLFEGTPEMMLSSLKKLRSLPADTMFFCGHEYTVNNLEFAINLEPDSAALREASNEMKKLREAGLPTVPARLEREFQMNPFLRWDDPVLKKALHMESASDLEVFTEVRGRRDRW